MARTARTRRRRDDDSSAELELELTPMIDVVFLLITFFLIVGALVSEELAPLHLPSADVPSSTLAPDELILNITRQGEYILHGMRVDDQQTLQRQLIVARATGTRRVLLRADQDTVYDRVQHVMIACSKADLLAIDLGVATKPLN